MPIELRTYRVTGLRPADTEATRDVPTFHPPEWTRRALCTNLDPEEFFPVGGNVSARVKAVCAVCPVSADCLDFALTTKQRHGTWAVLTTRERDRLTRGAA